MPRPPPWPIATLAAPLLLIALQGCSTPMNANANASSRYPPPGHLPAGQNRLMDGPLRFWEHNLGVYCFDTWGCTVRYGFETVVDRPSEEWQPGVDRLPANVHDRMVGTIGPYTNFQGPLTIEWRDKHRRPLQHTFQLDEIFADGRIRHDVPQSRIRQDAPVAKPDIVVEVNDRTLRIYMRALIPLTAPTTPDNPLSDSVDRNVLVHEVTL